MRETHLESCNLGAARLAGADLYGAYLNGTYLGRAQLERCDLRMTHLKDADFTQARLQGAQFEVGYELPEGTVYPSNQPPLEGVLLDGAYAKGVVFDGMHLERVPLKGTHLEGASLIRTHLEGANLSGARLEGADLRAAHLEGGDLRVAHLEEANLVEAHLDGSDLRGAWLDSKTVLSDATFDKNTRLGDIQWGGVGAVNLTQVDWTRVRFTGDEQGVGPRNKAAEHEALVRTYRQLAAQLRAQGMNEVADRFLYRAQVRQRAVLIRQGKVGAYLFSLLVLSALAGYGFRLWRILIAYGLTLVLFAAAYFASGQWLGATHLEWHESLLGKVT